MLGTPTTIDHSNHTRGLSDIMNAQVNHIKYVTCATIETKNHIKNHKLKTNQMKASELIKHLQAVCDSLPIDPDVVIVDDKLGKFDIEFSGTEGVATYDHPEQTSPHTVRCARIHLRKGKPARTLSI